MEDTARPAEEGYDQYHFLLGDMESCSDELVVFPARGVGLSGGWSKACLQKLLNSFLYCSDVQLGLCWHKGLQRSGGISVEEQRA